MPRSISSSPRPCPPRPIGYSTCISIPKPHAAFTGAAGDNRGRRLAARRSRHLAGAISGTILHVEPKRLIVQTWRSTHFLPESMDSVLVLSFYPEPDGGRIELVHVNVADEDFAGVSHGWEKYYWTPWRAYLSAPRGGSS